MAAIGKERKDDNAQRSLSQLQPWASKHTGAMLSYVRRAAHSGDVTSERAGCGVERMNRLLDGTWEGFEQ